MKKSLGILIVVGLMGLNGMGQTIADIDGNIYNTVTIGSQIWTKENLRTTKYSNGIPIHYEAVDSIWGGLTISAFCTYHNDTSYRHEYGNLYNFYAVIDSDKVCPAGWHVPSDGEWNILINYLGGDSIAGGKMREAGLTHWPTPNAGADNSSGLTVLPAGYRWSNYGFNPGKFNALNGNGAIWTTTNNSGSTAIAKYFYTGDAGVASLNFRNSYGMSVRCVSDVPAGINETKTQQRISISPNPFSTQTTLTLQGTYHNPSLFIYNLLGQEVRSIPIGTNTQITIPRGNLPAGMYFYKLIEDNKEVLGIGKIIAE